MNRMKNLTVVFCTLLFCLCACDKPEGKGGNSTIKGVVWEEDWNAAFTQFIDEYAAKDAEVFIIYGNETGVGDRVWTNYNGQYEFKYLRPGKYKVYVYSKDKELQAPGGEIAVIKEIDIKNDGDTFDADTLLIYN